VPYVLDAHPIIEHAVEDFKRVANERHHVHARPLFNFRRAQRVPTDPINDRPDACLKCLRYPIPKGAPAVGGDFSQVGDRAP